jgi:hypothetical protein
MSLIVDATSWQYLHEQSCKAGGQFLEFALEAIKKELGTEGKQSTLEEMRLAVDLSYSSSVDFMATSISVFADKLCDSLDVTANKLSDSLDGIARALGDE